MPKAFTKNELKNTKTKLLLNGKKIFEHKGFAKFGVRELVKETGISIGMFYKLYSSKEELFVEIVSIEQKRIRQSIVTEVMQYKDDPVKALKSFYYIVVKELYDNKLMNTILFNNEYSSLKSHLTEVNFISERELSLKPFVDLMNYWKSKKLIRDIDNELVLASLRSLVYLNFHKDEIGEDKFNNIVEFLVNQVCLYVEGGSYNA
ncbi:TetR/AcrR family transcriptional regulator [Clostridium sp. 'deep sea']|uniref:TetR/AcrR family transcriptional regulator n=1 Tax=Clostridium sp. 'deep sea' TaxID=2779445 RepID=UPI0018968558|nr:TetR/AcrR family transcriptional regulator [Clostridium sp. 'deep sea']QOR35099.1 TetR/AcrR family transcriptional regulator [Clostridium sp. 'deep sea']